MAGDASLWRGLDSLTTLTSLKSPAFSHATVLTQDTVDGRVRQVSGKTWFNVKVNCLRMVRKYRPKKIGSKFMSRNKKERSKLLLHFLFVLVWNVQKKIVGKRKEKQSISLKEVSILWKSINNNKRMHFKNRKIFTLSKFHCLVCLNGLDCH